MDDLANENLYTGFIGWTSELVCLQYVIGRAGGRAPKANPSFCVGVHAQLAQLVQLVTKR